MQAKKYWQLICSISPETLTMYQGENTIVDLNFNLFLTNHPLYHFTLSNARWFYFHDQWKSRLGDKHPDFKKHPDHPRQVYFLFTLVVGINDHRWPSEMHFPNRNYSYSMILVRSATVWNIALTMFSPVMKIPDYREPEKSGIVKILTKKWEPGFNPLPPRPAKFGQNWAVCYFTLSNTRQFYLPTESLWVGKG